MTVKQNLRIAFIGSAGIPNRYGGFESFLEHCSPKFAERVSVVYVTCDSALYEDREPTACGAQRIFIPIRANGFRSTLHDLVAFARVFTRVDCVVVLGVSAGLFFPAFRLLGKFSGTKLVVNIDGVEWRRSKHSIVKRMILRSFDFFAQRFAHGLVYDNAALEEFLTRPLSSKTACIPYSGDHVRRIPGAFRSNADCPRCLTICRIEPENNLETLIEGFLNSNCKIYTIVGNWENSDYSRSLRREHEQNPRLRLLDPIYDATALADLREECDVYLHGHSVGGTNPSLVEMIFYDCRLLCLDVAFNRETAGAAAEYFSTSANLAELLNSRHVIDARVRIQIRQKFRATEICSQYLTLISGVCAR